MNLKLRLKNKTTLVALVLAVIAFVYQILGIFGITAPVAQETWEQLVVLVANILVGLGVLVDPTTTGIKDSARAMTYIKPSMPPTLPYEEIEVEEVDYDEELAQHNIDNYGDLIENVDAEMGGEK